jgi:hypothetical protein|tara:strand:+ start:886 stop:1071 length:186 start_codon:yes stop_codon:yes gene_type:complete
MSDDIIIKELRKQNKFLLQRLEKAYEDKMNIRMEYLNNKKSFEQLKEEAKDGNISGKNSKT